MTFQQVLTTHQGDYDVLIAGGGPAGATLAIRLARLGWRVCVAESQRFPRRHVGVSLAPAIGPILDLIEVRNNVESDLVRVASGAKIHWAGYTNDSLRLPGRGTVHVDRGAFDQVLVEKARSSGAHILQPARVSSATRLKDGRWSATLESEGSRAIVRAHFLALATGRRSVLGARPKRLSVPTIALYGFWRNESKDMLETGVEAGVDCWFWAAPLPDRTIAAAVFLDPSSTRFQDVKTPTEVYRRAFAESRLLCALTSGSLIGPVVACSTSRQVTEPIESNMIRVGDAYFTVDPLSAQGVVHAMTSALQAAAVLNTVRSRPSSVIDAMTFYETKRNEIIATDESISMSYYRKQAEFTPTSFWINRQDGCSTEKSRGAGQSGLPPASIPLRFSTGASIDGVIALTGDYISVVPGLKHPKLERPLAFFKNAPITLLLAPLLRNPTLAVLLQEWGRYLIETDALSLLKILWEREVIEAGSFADGDKSNHISEITR